MRPGQEFFVRARLRQAKAASAPDSSGRLLGAGDSVARPGMDAAPTVASRASANADVSTRSRRVVKSDQ